MFFMFLSFTSDCIGYSVFMIWYACWHTPLFLRLSSCLDPCLRVLVSAFMIWHTFPCFGTRLRVLTHPFMSWHTLIHRHTSSCLAFMSWLTSPYLDWHRHVFTRPRSHVYISILTHTFISWLTFSCLDTRIHVLTHVHLFMYTSSPFMPLIWLFANVSAFTSSSCFKSEEFSNSECHRRHVGHRKS